MPLLALKFGPYAVIALLVVLLGIDHYRLIACDSQRQAADAANKMFSLDTKAANDDLAHAHSDLESEKQFQKTLQQKIDSRTSRMAVSIKAKLSNPPTGTCDQLMGDLANKLGTLK